jgi:hypothetical protein
VMGATMLAQVVRRPGMSDCQIRDHNPGRPFGLGENGAAAAGPSGPKAGPLAGLCG